MSKKGIKEKNKRSKEEIKATLKERFNKKNEILIFVLSAALSFTIFFFSPIDIYLGNQKEFIVNFKHVLFPMLILSILATGIIGAILNLFLRIKQIVFDAAVRLIFGYLLAIYTQSLFLNSKMTSITGDDSKYTDNMYSLVLNMLLMLAILLLPLIIYALKRQFPNNKVLNFGKGMLIPYVSALIFAMQFSGTAVSIINTDFGKYEKLHTSYLSYEPTMSLSEEGNIVVFLLDRLDSLWMDDAIKSYPDIKEKLDGFTFYQNNIAHYTNTFPSVPRMLTNSPYDGTEWADYICKAWEGRTVPKILTENGYSINLLIDNLTTYGSLGQLSEQCNNIASVKEEDASVNYFGEGGIIPTMTQLSMAKLSPYSMKPYITLGLGSNLSSDFVKYTVNTDDMLPMATGVEGDLKYFEYLKNNEMTADNCNKTFSFIHLNGVHGSSEEISSLYSGFKKVNKASTIRGDLEIVFEYMDKMKELGIYENSTFIIIGDHGRAAAEIEVDKKAGLEDVIVTAVLVKPAGAESGKLKLDRYSELSNDYFPASILEYAGLDHSDMGYSYNDIIENNLHIDRYLQTFDFRGYGRTVYKPLYKITGDARDFYNWEKQDEHE